MELLKLLSGPEIIAQIFSFLILFFILKTFLWKPVLKLLDERKAKMASDFQKIEDVKKEVSSLKNEFEEKLESVHAYGREKIRESIEEGRKAAEEIKKEAQASARALVDDAKIGIEIEIAKARMRLKKEVVDLTIMATEEIVQQKLTEEQDKKLVVDFLEKLDQA
ncbi:MAG TPA: F0F1 ATP synthase subunit B [Candidatus Omnitrophota bacterium]|nr:F0F1 ATP synthase subunit B [Candidatus Omnitrophota bacterium]HPN88565.1 F0F1 ATP synthase subunit B [Candidatus Omnitrophota bacterium]